MDDTKILAVIPARGGSKGLPKKNIKSLLEKPLIAWTIEQAKNSKHIDRVVVSTEDKEIAEISKKYGAEVVERPEELARDDSPTFDAIIQVLDYFQNKGEFFDIMVLLEPTSPLRKDNDLDNAIELFIKNIDKADSLVSVGEVQLENPYIMKKIEEWYVKPIMKLGKNAYQRQKLPKVYFPYGAIYLSKIEELKEHKTFYQERTIPYFIERWQNYEIDDIYDFIAIESILKYKLKEEK
ncbi:Acylneuraminate cytidylyltransferase [groundwater metagenome]|uniref:Acylneuraminate cytidylyltransferase n=1 Tax=groundwater metagenome TaxID=717931 RepID=A0A098EDH6_9ZZZZ